MDLFDKVRNYTRVKEAKEMGIYPYFQPLQNSEGTTARIDGKEVVMIGSNNYLGLTTHPKVRKAAMDAIDTYGTSCTGSRFLNGTLELHLELERRLARFHGAEAAFDVAGDFVEQFGNGIRQPATAAIERHTRVMRAEHFPDGCAEGFCPRVPHGDVDRAERPAMEAFVAKILRLLFVVPDKRPGLVHLGNPRDLRPRVRQGVRRGARCVGRDGGPHLLRHDDVR